MNKRELATNIERHHLYEPITDGIHSKNYYRYSSENEIRLLMKLTKAELQEWYDMGYDPDGAEKSRHEINW